MEISHVARLSIPVSDQDRAMDFYVNKLGLKLVRPPADMMPGSKWVEVGTPGSATTMILANWLGGMKPGGVEGLMLESKNLDADVDRLKQAGVEVEASNTPWGKQAMFKDPDGNGIVLCEADAS